MKKKLRVFGPQLKTIREKMDLNQEDFGKKLGMTQAEISRIEQAADTRLSTFLEIASALDLLPSDLMKQIEGAKK